MAIFGGLVVFAILLLGFAIPLAMRFYNADNPDKAINLAKPETQENLRTVDLQGIWQQNGSMAAGWADRYHFYPSGTFHYYPDEMTCSQEKIEKIGTWKYENTILTLTTTKQVAISLEIYPGGLCSVIGKKK